MVFGQEMVWGLCFLDSLLSLIGQLDSWIDLQYCPLNSVFWFSVTAFPNPPLWKVCHQTLEWVGPFWFSRWGSHSFLLRRLITLSTSPLRHASWNSKVTFSSISDFCKSISGYQIEDTIWKKNFIIITMNQWCLRQEVFNEIY